MKPRFSSWTERECLDAIMPHGVLTDAFHFFFSMIGIATTTMTVFHPKWFFPPLGGAKAESIPVPHDHGKCVAPKALVKSSQLIGVAADASQIQLVETKHSGHSV